MMKNKGISAGSMCPIAMSRKMILTLLMGVMLFSAYPQDPALKVQGTDSSSKINPCLHRNVLYVSGGLLFGSYIAGNYERIFLSSKNQVVSVLGRIAIGKVHFESLGMGFSLFYPVIYSTEYNLVSYLANIGILIGSRSSHLDCALGVAYLDGTVTRKYSAGDYQIKGHQEVNPVISLGYRYQKPDGHFLFRVGIGWPEQIYISMGFCL